MKLKGKRILVPGGAGFLGSFLVPKLEGLGAEVHIPRREYCDLRDYWEAKKAISDSHPHIIINLAGSVGGLPYNAAHAADLFIDNILPGMNLMMAAKYENISKFVQIGSICEYPSETPVPFKESDLWNGYPEETNAPYGIAKRSLLALGRGLRKQYGLNVVHALLANLYGPNDDFGASGHVIPGIIAKMGAAGRIPPVLFGDGSPTREFLYADDAAEAIIAIAETYDSPEPINVGNGHEISIRELADTIAGEMGYRGEIRWDASKPNGQMRRCVDTSRIDALGWRAKTTLAQGLKKTVDWYRSQNKVLVNK